MEPYQKSSKLEVPVHFVLVDAATAASPIIIAAARGRNFFRRFPVLLALHEIAVVVGEDCREQCRHGGDAMVKVEGV